MPQRSYDLKKIIIIGIIVLIIAGLIGFLILRKKNNAPVEPTNPNDLFPYGTTTGGTTPGGSTEVPPTPENPPGTGEPLGAPITMTSAAALRQITNYPVTNLFASVGSKIITEPKLDEKTGQTVFTSRTVPIDSVRWNVKQTGILMDADVGDGAIIQKQLTDTQVPGAQELWFSNSARTMIYRSFNDINRTIDSFKGTLPSQNLTLGYCTVPFTLNTKQGSKGAEVKELQNYLNNALLISMTTDGSFGAKTVSALLQIQVKLGIAPTGIMDAGTIAAINTDCAQIQENFAKKQNEPLKLTGAFITSGILRGTVSPDGSKIFYLVRKSGGGVSGIVANYDGSSSKTVFTSPITEWMPQWVNASTIAMTTLASRESVGYLYFLNPATGAMKKIMGPAQGLTTLVNPAGDTVIYSISNNNGITSGLYSVATGKVTILDLTTFPAKCAWGTNQLYCGIPDEIPRGQYPDVWYQGLVGFKDDIWSINPMTGATSIIATPEPRIDANLMQVSPDGKYLYFVNKNDETLWSLKLN